eukprot:g23601.t1
MNLPPAKESSSRLDMPAVPQVAIKKLNKSGGIADRYAAGDLFDYLAANGAMPEPAAVTLMLCLLSALTHLHQLGVVHRDVKAENILLDRSKAVLSDLGIAAYIKDEEAMQKRVGSPGYAPPEVDEKVDVFGSGVVLFFALSNTLPFPGKSLKKVLELTARCKVRYNASLFGEYSGSIMQLLKALRPSAKKSFISLWTLAKPDVRSSSAAKAAFQAVEDGVDRGYRPAPSASASAPNASPTAATGPLGPTPTTSAPMKVVRNLAGLPATPSIPRAWSQDLRAAPNLAAAASHFGRTAWDGAANLRLQSLKVTALRGPGDELCQSGKTSFLENMPSLCSSEIQCAEGRT